MAALTSPGYRSSTAYQFGEEQTDAIVRTTAYHRRDYALSLIWFSPREHASIRSSITTPFPRPSNVELGSLDQLPLELLHDTLFLLDMHSLFRFRQINSKSRQTIDSHHRYQVVVTHGLNLFCALLRTRLAAVISISDFYNALCTKLCDFCGEFGGFMSLLIWKSSCFECLQDALDTQVHSVAAVRKQYNLTQPELDQLRTFKTLPGIYSMEESVYKSRVAVISLHQVMLVRRQSLRPSAMPQLLDSKRARAFRFMSSCALPYYDRTTGKIEHGISCAGCQLALEKDIIGTRGEDWAFKARDKVYAQDSFLEHFRWCKQAQLLWNSSCEGQKQPAELPEAARRRGYFNRRE